MPGRASGAPELGVGLDPRRRSREPGCAARLADFEERGANKEYDGGRGRAEAERAAAAERGLGGAALEDSRRSLAL